MCFLLWFLLIVKVIGKSNNIWVIYGGIKLWMDGLNFIRIIIKIT